MAEAPHYMADRSMTERLALFLEACGIASCRWHPRGKLQVRLIGVC